MKVPNKIRCKIFLSILSILVASYSILLFATIRNVNASLDQKMDAELEADLGYARGQYLSYANEIRATLQTPALTWQLHQGIIKHDRQELERALLVWKRSLPSVDVMLITDGERKPLVQYNGRLCTPRCLKLYSVFEAAKERLQPVISTEVIPAETVCEGSPQGTLQPHNTGEAMVLVVAVPVVDATNHFLGCIVAADILNNDAQVPYRAKKVFDKEVEISISLHGKRITSTLKDEQVVPADLPPKIMGALEQGQTFRGKATIGGKRYKTIYEPIRDIRGNVIGSLSVSLSQSDIERIRLHNLRNIIVSGVVGIVLAFGMAVLFARQFSRPLNALMDGVKSLEKGEPVEPVEVAASVGDEFSKLANAFNSMLTALKERDGEILQKRGALEAVNQQLVHLNEELGQRVDDRTQELKVEMERLEAILTSIVEGVIVTDRDNRIILFNPAAQHIFNMVPHRVMGKPLDIICKQGNFCVLGQHVNNLAESGSSGSASQQLLTIDGLRLKVNIAPMLDEAGVFAGAVISVHDVTVEGEVDRMKSEFISTVSHELKTPLTSIKGSLDFIVDKGKNLSETERELMQICRRNTDRLMRLISDILDITRIESGGMPFVFKSCDIGELVTCSIEEMATAAATRHIMVQNETDTGLPPVYVDGDRIIQVITNLLANAIKFSPEGGVVTVRSTFEDNHVLVSVADNGDTIQWSDRNKLFKRFQQLDGSDRREHGGTGLGLAICKEIIERHHGHIFFREGKEGGNEFSFTVPVYEEQT